MNEPTVIEPGTTLAWTAEYAEYPSADWDLSYRVVNADSLTNWSTSANDDDVRYDVEIAPAETAVLTPGAYDLIGYVTNAGGAVHRVYRAPVTVLPNVLGGAAVDIRTSARIALDALDAMLSGNASSMHQTQVINGRQITRYSVPELMQLRAHFKAIVDAEDGKSNTPFINIDHGFTSPR